MFCNECGHDLGVNGVCPVCGWSPSQSTSNPTPPNSLPNNQINNIPNMRQPHQQFGQPQMGQPQQFGQPQMGQPAQPFGQPQMRQPAQQFGQPQMWQQPQQQFGQPQMGQPQQQFGQPQMWQQPQRFAQPVPQMSLSDNKPKKSKVNVPLIVGISLLSVCLIVGIAFIIKGSKTKDYTKEKTETTTEIYTEDTTERTTEDTTETTTEAPIIADEGTKTIMMYVVGSDLESNHDAASEDFQEILQANFNEENVNFLIYTGGCLDWDMSIIPDDGNSIFIIEDGNLELLETEDSKNMGDPDTLSDFLEYGYNNYPAEQYSLIFWNHGGGAFSGYGYDELTQDSLWLVELQEAFSNSPFNESNKLEWIGFDACLMANIETAHILSPYANYMVASQQVEPGFGWDYEFLTDIDTMATGEEIGTAIVDSYIGTCEDNFILNPFAYTSVSLSVLDLNQVANVENSLNDLFAVADSALSKDTYGKYSRIRSSSKEIAPEYTGEYSYDIIDLVDFSKKMETEHVAEATALNSALKSFIVYADANETNNNGVSIYHPYHAKDYSTYYLTMYRDFDFAENYTSYITNFSTLLLGDDTLNVEWDPSSLIPVANGDLTFSLQLSPEQAAGVQNMYYVISRADTERPGNFIFVSMSNQVDMNSNCVLTANFDGNVIYMQNDTTYDQYEIMYTEQEATDSYTRYLISSILFNDNINEEDAMYTYFVMETSDAYPQGQLLGAYPIANFIYSNGTEIFPSNAEINIYDYQYIAFGAFTHEFTSEEDLTNFNEADWSDVELWYNQMPVTEGFSTVLGGMIPGIPYYGMFIIEDTQGNRHCSNMVQIQ